MLMTNRKKIVCASVLAVVIVVGIVFTNFWLSKKVYEVTFHSDDNSIIKVDEVQRNDSAEPPVIPIAPNGKVFKKWDTDFAKVKGNLDIKAVYEETAGKPNVFALSGTYGAKEEYVHVPFQLCGNVCLSGFDLIIKYDSKVLKLDSVYNEDGGIVCNYEKPGQIKINYVSSVNTTGIVDICNFKFLIISSEVKESPIELIIKKSCKFKDDEKIVDTEYSAINSSVFVIK